MQKKIIEIPIYEKVKTGAIEKEIWITSDGKEFEHEDVAEYHEFYDCKLNERGFDLPYHVTILDLHCKEDLERYEDNRTSDVSNFKYDKNTLSFPGTYILYEIDENEPIKGEDEYYDYPEWSLYCVTLEEYKKFTINRMNQIKSI